MGASDAPENRELRSFGRRHGRKFSAAQEQLLAVDLPRVRVDLDIPPPQPLAELFVSPVHEVWLEIGFGGGEHLLWQAAHHPDVGLIGCEPYLDGVVKVLSGIRSQKCERIWLHADDARPLLRWLPENSIARAFVLFPDPWPKARHHKRRLISPVMVDALSRVIRPGGQFRLATDIGDYARTSLLALTASPRFRWLAEGPGDWRERLADWPQTRYEQKAVAAGRRCYFLSFERI